MFDSTAGWGCNFIEKHAKTFIQIMNDFAETCGMFGKIMIFHETQQIGILATLVHFAERMWNIHTFVENTGTHVVK